MRTSVAFTLVLAAMASVAPQSPAQDDGNKVKIRTAKDEVEIEVTSKRAFPAVGGAGA